jgi:hypothetical protein
MFETAAEVLNGLKGVLRLRAQERTRLALIPDR